MYCFTNIFIHTAFSSTASASRCHSALLADSSQLTADSFYLLTAFPHHGYRSFTFALDDALPFVITQNGGRKRIFILFFCVIPPSQYPPSGFAGHLLINKEAYPIPILTVRALS